MKPRWVFGMFFAASLVSGCATQTRTSPAPSPLKTNPIGSNGPTIRHTGPIVERDEENRKKVLKAVQMIIAGQDQAAIDKILAPIIDTYEAAYAGNNARVYCASDLQHAQRYIAYGEKANAQAGTTNRKIIVIGSAWAQAHWAEGYAYNDMGQYAKAESELWKAMALSPGNSQYTSELGFVYLKAKNWAKALDLYKKAEQDSKLAPASNTHVRCVALRGKGFALEGMGQLDAASTAYRACLKLSPADPKSRAELVYIRHLKQDKPPSPPETSRQ